MVTELYLKLCPRVTNLYKIVNRLRDVPWNSVPQPTTDE